MYPSADTGAYISVMVRVGLEYGRQSGPGDRSETLVSGRKVRTGQGTVVVNGHRQRCQGKCHRKYTADGRRASGATGKGEMVRYERTARPVTVAAR